MGVSVVPPFFSDHWLPPKGLARNGTMVDTTERLQVLLAQEVAIYQTSDYLARMQTGAQQVVATAKAVDRHSSFSEATTSPKKRKCFDDDEEVAVDRSPSATACRGTGEDSGTSSTMINKHWREKICEWAYQGE